MDQHSTTELVHELVQGSAALMAGQRAIYRRLGQLIWMAGGDIETPPDLPPHLVTADDPLASLAAVIDLPAPS